MSQWSWKQAVADHVLDIVNASKSARFNLADVYNREAVFQSRFPANRHVREKIRQTLQRLRDVGFVNFLGEGDYSLNLEFDELDFENAGADEEGIVMPQTKTVVRTVRLRNTLLASHIKNRYDYRCQVCRETVPLKDRGFAEAHHMKPLGAPHFGPDVEGNIIVVCPNHHVMFDHGALRIDPGSLMVVHVAGTFPPQRLYLESWHELNMRCLEYHAEHVFGKI